MEQLNAVEVPEEMTGLPVFNGTDTPDSFFITGGDLTTATGSIINLDRTVSGEHTIDCYQYAKFDYEVPAIIICGICVLAGLIYCFFGKFAFLIWSLNFKLMWKSFRISILQSHTLPDRFLLRFCPHLPDLGKAKVLFHGGQRWDRGQCRDRLRTRRRDRTVFGDFYHRFH